MQLICKYINVDTSADCNIMNMYAFKWVTNRCAQHVHSPRVSLTAFGGGKLKTYGQVSLVVNHRREKRKLTIEIGRQSSLILVLAKRVHMMQCSYILGRYADLFTVHRCRMFERRIGHKI